MLECKRCKKAVGEEYVPRFVASFKEAGIDESGNPWWQIDADIVLCHYCGGDMHWEDEADCSRQSMETIPEITHARS